MEVNVKLNSYVIKTVSVITLLLFNANAFASEESIFFAKMEKVNGKFTITKLSDNYKDLSDGIIIRVDNETDLADKSTFSCGWTFFGTKEPCFGEQPFRKVTTNVFKTCASYVFTGFIFPILGVFPILKTSEYDHDAFEYALREAKDGGYNRNDIIRKESELASYVKSKDKRLTQFIDNTSTEIIYKYESAAKNKYKLKYNVVDESGFYGKNKNDTFNVYVNFNDAPKFKHEYNKYTIKAGIIANNKLNEFFENQYKIIDAYYKNEYDKVNVELSIYDKMVADVYKTANINYDRTGMVENKYNYEMDCQQQISLIKDNNIIPVTVTIKSINFGTLFPPFINEDNNIKITSNGQTVNIKNKTKNYLQVKSISVYHSGAINNNTYSDVLELPPNAVKEHIPIENIIDNIIKYNATYNDVHIGGVNNKQIKYGIAVKYRLVEQNIDKTLYKENNYSLIKLLKANL